MSNHSHPFRDKTILVTGASSGIGRATALAFGARRANVLVHYNRRRAEAAPQRWPPPAQAPRRIRMRVTPEVSRQWLERNVHNRPLSDDLVIAYMVDMLDGRWQYNRPLADRFFDELAHGLNLSPDNPVYHLRERLLADRRAKAKLPQLEIVALFFKVWLYYRDGRPLRKLFWKTDGPAPEKFPDIGERGR